RNFIPEVCDVAYLKDLDKYLSENNYICYESSKNIVDVKCEKSLTFVIGPEGGFEDREYEKIREMGYEPISLGKRILRAETAAIYMTSIIVGKCQ
ncbi:MAG: RNA methyltransferase, partial [Erysipelotrichaceae bacterium]|nr:RNA methyltransferase [Erysipelotrichaceae bacterium]